MTTQTKQLQTIKLLNIIGITIIFLFLLSNLLFPVLISAIKTGTIMTWNTIHIHLFKIAFTLPSFACHSLSLWSTNVTAETKDEELEPLIWATLIAFCVDAIYIILTIYNAPNL